MLYPCWIAQFAYIFKSNSFIHSGRNWLSQVDGAIVVKRSSGDLPSEGPAVHRFTKDQMKVSFGLQIVVSSHVEMERLGLLLGFALCP